MPHTYTDSYGTELPYVYCQHCGKPVTVEEMVLMAHDPGPVPYLSCGNHGEIIEDPNHEPDWITGQFYR